MSYGQASTVAQSMDKVPEPLYIINSNVIGNGFIEQLDPKKIKQVVVYKGQDGPTGLKNLTSGGVLAITYDGQIDSVPLAEVGAKQRGRGPVGFQLNGKKLDASQVASLRIVPEAIGQVLATTAASETVVNIRLAEGKAKNKPNAPGSIRIR